MERKNGRKERGQSMVELALLLPILLLILAGVLDLGRLFYSYVAVTDAAAEGAAYAAIHPTDDVGIRARAQAASGGLVVIEQDMVQISSGGGSVTVTVGYTFTLATPFVSGYAPDGLLLRGVATEVTLSSW